MAASAEDVYDRWREQYKGERSSTTAKLKELGPTGDPNEVAEAIGNRSWTHPQCLSCGEYVSVAVEFFDGYDSEAAICKECLQAGMEELNRVMQTTSLPHESPFRL